MNLVPYPCWGLSFSEPVEDVKSLAASLLEWRSDENWLLLGGHSAISDRQLWTAWLGVVSRRLQGTMRSHNSDAEFIRLVAGTHQIRIGFNRAGVANGDQTAWLIHIPDSAEGEIGSMQWPELDRIALDEEAARLMRVLDANLLTHRPMPSSESINRLELQLESDSNSEDFLALERAALAHIALADMQ
jgi:tRNA threonylcarbamoyladenosine modification (KEOPS) complex Cgi121 subunit